MGEYTGDRGQVGGNNLGPRENKVSGVWVQLVSIETGVHVCGAIRASRRQRSVPLLSAWPFVGTDLLRSLPRDF